LFQGLFSSVRTPDEGVMVSHDGVNADRFGVNADRFIDTLVYKSGLVDGNKAQEMKL
jgi:hypothetical protein